MKKLAVLNSLAACLILAAVLAFFTGPAQADVVTITDFSGWQENGPNKGLFHQSPGGPLSFNDASGGKSDMLQPLGPISVPSFRAVQFSNFHADNSTTPGNWSASTFNYLLFYGSTTIIICEGRYDSGGSFFQAVAKNNDTQTRTALSAPYYTSADSGWLGMGYGGGVATFWYNTGAGWKEIASYAPNFGGIPTAAIVGNNPGQSLSFQVNQIQVFNGSTSPVPLPPSVYLLGSGLLGLAGWRRFRKG